MEELTEEEIEFLERSIVLMENKDVTEILRILIGRQIGMLSTDAGNDSDLREQILWEITALCSAIMQLRPGGWSMEDLIITPVQIIAPEAETSEDPQ